MNTIKRKIQKQKRKQLKSKVKSTLDWIDIETINEHHIELKSGKKKEIMVGIKLEPHSLFLDNSSEQKRRIHMLRSALNRLTFDLWHGFVFNPVNLDTHLYLLTRQMMVETDDVIREMLEDDMEKARAFIFNFRELEFFMMIKGKPGSKFEDQYHQLQIAIQNAGFTIKQLNRLDFDNLISYQFENQIINDFYFSRGLFDDQLTPTIDLSNIEENEDEDE